jgi:RNA polymerase sigma-70 factor (ECF subfamily)
VKAEARAEFREALGATAPDLLGYLERRVSAKDDAADLLAETMLQAWRRVDAMPEAPERRRMWFFTVAANVLANHTRSSRRRSALADRLRHHLAPADQPDHAEAAAIRDAVLRLPEGQRELVRLVHWDGFSISEGAEILGLNPSTARSRYAAARELLRQALTAVTPSA